MPSPPPTRLTLLWLSIAVVLVITAGVTGRTILRAKALRTPIAAYLVPIDNTTHIKTSWWPSTRLALPRALRSGEHIAIPADTRLTLIHADTGVAEPVTGPTKFFLQHKLPSEPDALISPLPEILAAVNTQPHTDNTIIVTSPVGLTRYLNPSITWIAREGTTYDVAVTDAADSYVPPRLAKNVRPPLALADLETPQRRQLGADRNYVIIIRETNSTTTIGGARLLTTTDAQLQNTLPTAPAELIAEAAAAMAKSPTRTGDAWLALARLPPDWARSELGVRLRLRVAAALGHSAELARALADARALKSP